MRRHFGVQGCVPLLCNITEAVGSCNLIMCREFVLQEYWCILVLHIFTPASRSKHYFQVCSYCMLIHFITVLSFLTFIILQSFGAHMQAGGLEGLQVVTVPLRLLTLDLMCNLCCRPGP
jgi:hypothetical protein